MARCDCCGCALESDYGTSIVTGEGDATDPYVIALADPGWVRPAVRIRRTTNQSIASGASYAAVSFDTEVFDQGGFWIVGSPTLLTIPADGLYIFGGCAEWAANATGTRELGIRLNGTIMLQVDDQPPESTNGATLTPWMNLSYQYRLGVGSTLELVARQESGGALDLVAEADDSITLWAVYVGRTV